MEALVRETGLEEPMALVIATEVEQQLASARQPPNELNDRFFKVVSWYDNEAGYANRCLDMITMMAEGDGKA